MSSNGSIRFIDLFAGLGGFHSGLARIPFPCECVFACELDPELRDLYRKNFGIAPAGDIRSIKATEVPDHDICCAGFPCQPFSKAGEQLGTECEMAGDLFEGHLLRIIRKKLPKLLLLENVPNLARHKGGRTWSKMQRLLEAIGYTIDFRVLSPHRFGVPQVRERLFIVGSLDGLGGFKWPEPSDKPVSVIDVLDKSPVGARPIPDAYVDCLSVWEEFLKLHPEAEQIPHPLWTMEFGATYPFEGGSPAVLTPRTLSKYKGAYGRSLSDLEPSERVSGLPTYARSLQPLPEWKKQFIRQNRAYYATQKGWIHSWLAKLARFPPSLQKLEWNCKGESRTVWDKVIQFRASGVRVKRPTTAPALIAMTTTQVPIIAAQRRYMTARECSRLQSLGSLEYLPASPTRTYRALGNAVNAELVYRVGERLIGSTNTLTESCHRGKSLVLSQR